MKLSNEIAWCIFGISASIFLRLCTTLHPYSGQGKPPMFGDYEAQRHWMEITVNLPMNQWYHNTSSNNLEYWGLDYPPLTAYHSYLNGLIAWIINPNFVQLNNSRGYESEEHKLFMRYTVILADILIYIPSVVIFYLINHKNTTRHTKLPLQSIITLSLLYPGLILIDHGHFQYNCISLGFTILAIAALSAQYDIIASIMFCLSVNYKQMELYHAFPFFLYLLSSCIPKPGASALSGIVKLFKIAITVLVTFSLLWLPFLFKLEDTLQVIHRLFPIARGLFEDKVANVWCALNILYKFRDYCPVQMVRYCTIATLAALLPSSANLFLNPSFKKFIPALINSSLAFFLFSYQVHEKSILLAAIPVMLYLPQKPLQCFWFLYISSFSMLPLLIKDKLVIAYLSLTLFYLTSFVYCHERWGMDGKFEATFTKFITDLKRIIVGKLKEKNPSDYSTSLMNVLNVSYKYFVEDVKMLKDLILYMMMFASFIGSVLLTVLILVFEPPVKYPDLYTLMIAVYSCGHFVAFFVYFNVVQFKVPEQFEECAVNCAKVKQS
ncbi:dolichyl pyrophosphate Man9GlcNAc2 alpha-1,3-glucosyltransferase [Atheta coriaria]|uniref:dolichyl pyrophosphate Man9GlcNAc2 alpha-1,3-glucosyltransferase n=1 Tax=Dalotia coriaria TaxID=877792 RepID=UPI0031F347A3